jgi:hypothetical protein
MPPVMTGVLAAWGRGALPRRAWWMAVALQAVLALSTVAALRSGEADEGRAERVVPEAALEAHEEATEMFPVGAALVLAITSGAGAVRGQRSAEALAALATVGTLAVLCLGCRTGEARRTTRLPARRGRGVRRADRAPHDGDVRAHHD